MFLNEFVPSKHFQNFKLPTDIQAIPKEVNLKQRKLLILSIYTPLNQNLDLFLNSMGNMLDLFFKVYGDLITLGDSNKQNSNSKLSSIINQLKVS